MVTTEKQEDRTVDVSHFVAVCNEIGCKISTMAMPCLVGKSAMVGKSGSGGNSEDDGKIMAGGKIKKW